MSDLTLCGDCRYWDRPDGYKPEFARCRRRAPVTIVRAELDEPLEAAWPVTHHSDGCGEGEAPT